MEKQLLATPTPASAPRTTAAKPLKTVPHDVAGHMPHDPNCEACRRARMVAPPAHRTRDPRAVSDSDRGFVLGLDLYGPFSADVGEHVYALVGVETGRTDYGMVRLLKDRTTLACREALKSMRHELRSMSSDPKVDLVRVHADDDSSFKGECGEYIAGEGLRSTDTGGYCPTKNSRTERRIRMINEAFRANLLVATGGIDEYEKLWGPGLEHAMHCSNVSQWSDGRCPYKALTGKDYSWAAEDHAFGEDGLVFVQKEKRSSKFQTPTKAAVWVGRCHTTPKACRVVPIVWDPSLGAYTLQPVETVGKFEVTRGSFILRVS